MLSWKAIPAFEGEWVVESSATAAFRAWVSARSSARVFFGDWLWLPPPEVPEPEVSALLEEAATEAIKVTERPNWLTSKVRVATPVAAWTLTLAYANSRGNFGGRSVGILRLLSPAT